MAMAALLFGGKDGHKALAEAARIADAKAKQAVSTAKRRKWKPAGRQSNQVEAKQAAAAAQKADEKAKPVEPAAQPAVADNVANGDGAALQLAATPNGSDTELLGHASPRDRQFLGRRRFAAEKNWRRRRVGRDRGRNLA